jgi:pantoate--beta-alanine ligase
VIVSLFVNPTQFNDQADLAAYPRDEARDARMAGDAGVDVLFAPSVEELYPPGFSTRVQVRDVSEPLEGMQRGREHFEGVATIVAKLLNIAAPDVAFFGQKDAQQALVVRRLVRDLDLPVEIEVCPTVREPDGLAMSSRNVRLDGPARAQALALKRGLDAAEAALRRGERRGGELEAAGRAAMAAFGVTPEYLAVVSAGTLAPIDDVATGAELLVAVAARIGGVRLIDNVLLRVE